MDTSKYDPATRKEMKRVTRHPAYRALHARYAAALADANKLRGDLRSRDGDISKLADENTALKEKIEKLTTSKEAA